VLISINERERRRERERMIWRVVEVGVRMGKMSFY